MLQDTITAMPLPAIVIASSERIVVANAKALELLGQGVVGRHFITIIRQPALLDAVEVGLRRAETRSARYLSNEARRDRTWRATVSPIGASGSVLVTFEDQTDMQDAGTQRRDFVANVSHELRTPLTALLGFIETLQGAARKDPAAQERFLGIMHNEASRMNRLVHELLTLNRVESEERIRPNSEVDVARTAGTVVNALAPLAENNKVTLTSTGLEAPAAVLGDADQLSQVVTNLLENAIKYSGRGSRVEVSISRSEDHPMLRSPAVTLSITDSGEGIDPIHIPRLTERFYRIDTHRSREKGGTGLGLAIVKHIVNRHRGRLRVESEPGRGSTFSVILPAFQNVTENS